MAIILKHGYLDRSEPEERFYFGTGNSWTQRQGYYGYGCFVTTDDLKRAMKSLSRFHYTDVNDVVQARRTLTGGMRLRTSNKPGLLIPPSATRLSRSEFRKIMSYK